MEKKIILFAVFASLSASCLAQADWALEAKPLSVMMKSKVAASGDKHDYLSQAPFYWANVETTDGLPYVQLDRGWNPETFKLDRTKLNVTAKNVSALAEEYFKTGDERYAEHAVLLLKTWFTDPATRMNPRMEYGQMVPGVNGGKGRRQGIIETYPLVGMLNKTKLLESSKAFAADKQNALKAWFREYLHWLTTDATAVKEGEASNNHATSYYTQVIAYALYTGDRNTAKHYLESFAKNRIYAEIMPDGSQPQELKRPYPYAYSLANLEYMSDAIKLAEDNGINVFTKADIRRVDAGREYLRRNFSKQELKSGWEFVRTDMANAWEVFRPVQKNKPESVPVWQRVSLPHCYNATDAVEPGVNYYEGPAWYRTMLSPASPYADGRILLQFDGAGQKTDVYVYIRKVGSHVGGYDKWSVDITDVVREFKKSDVCQLQFGGQVPVAVRTDNSRDVEMIPSDMSDFTLYGGLYRKVRLVYLPKESIPEDVVHVEGNNIVVSAPETTQVEVVSPDGKTIYKGRNKGKIKVKSPVKWDVDSPKLYTVKITYGEQQFEKRIGFRDYEFKEHGPFFLNGRRLLLQGTHRHEDHAGVGAAMTDELITREMKQIKDMGANFIRLGHYQQSDRVLDLCDSLGILVWEEIPWCRGGLGGEKYKAQALRMQKNMIEQHRSHPAVILWGLGNENDWQGDFPKYEKDSIRAFMDKLNSQAHRLDPQRMTCIRRCDFCSDIVDVYSPTIWAGWYSKRFTDYRSMEEAAIKKYPHFLHAEWGGDSHARRHAEGGFDIEAGDKNGDWSESYIVRLFDWHLKEQQQMPDLTGAAFWTFKDFATPLRPNNPIPYVNEKGVVERDGTPKESYYVFQSYWTKKPMLHIYGHTWPIRWGEKGEKKEILVYSNQPEVELFVNGVSQGKKKRNIADYPAAGFHWDVVLRNGDNVIEAKAGKLTDRIEQRYQTEKWGVPVAFRLDKNDTASDGTATIEVQLVDNNGIPCLDARNRISFDIAGDGKLIVDQGTSTGTSSIEAYNGRAIIKAKLTGNATLAAKAKGVKTIFIETRNN